MVCSICPLPRSAEQHRIVNRLAMDVAYRTDIQPVHTIQPGSETQLVSDVSDYHSTEGTPPTPPPQSSLLDTTCTFLLLSLWIQLWHPKTVKRARVCVCVCVCVCVRVCVCVSVCLSFVFTHRCRGASLCMGTACV